jgi:hypothetical protein
MNPYEVENQQLKLRIVELEEHLKRYTNNEWHKRYYENNKEQVIQKANKRIEQLKVTNPDKIKEYARTAYLKRKEKDRIKKENNE